MKHLPWKQSQKAKNQNQREVSEIDFMKLEIHMN